MGQGQYRDCIKDYCQTNLDEISHTIEKLRKSAKKYSLKMSATLSIE